MFSKRAVFNIRDTRFDNDGRNVSTCRSLGKGEALFLVVLRTGSEGASLVLTPPEIDSESPVVRAGRTHRKTGASNA